MNRFAIAAAAAAVLLLALRHPAAAPAGLQPLPTPQRSQHSREWHPARRAAQPLVVVYVTGEVAHPGVYRFPLGARAEDAVERAGGLRAEADPAGVNLAERLSDGEEIAVPRAGDATPRPARKRRARKRFKAKTQAPAQAVDLNQADAQTLAALPGIGTVLAERIVEYRRLNGPFASVDELADVAGMTQHRVDAVASYVTLNDGP